MLSVYYAHQKNPNRPIAFAFPQPQRATCNSWKIGAMSTERVSVKEFRGGSPSKGGRGVQWSVNTVCLWMGLDFWPLFPEKKAFGHEAFGHASAFSPAAELVTEQDDAFSTFQ